MGRGPVLSDEMWARVEPLLPAQYGKGRPFRDHRQVIEGIVFRYRAGIPWRDLPREFGPWQTAWKRHRRFSLDGTWDEVLAILQAEADAAGRDRLAGLGGLLEFSGSSARRDRDEVL